MIPRGQGGRHQTAPATEWRPMSTAPKRGAIILNCGETIPDRLDVRSGEFIPGTWAAELGYPEYAKHGGWLIWIADSDFYLIAHDASSGWTPLPGRERVAA